MTDLKKICPHSTIGQGNITVTEEDITELYFKWNEIERKDISEKRKKDRSWRKIKNRLVK